MAIDLGPKDKGARRQIEAISEQLAKDFKELWEAVSRLNQRTVDQSAQIKSFEDLHQRIRKLEDKLFPKCGECGQPLPPRRLIGDPSAKLMHDIVPAGETNATPNPRRRWSDHENMLKKAEAAAAYAEGACGSTGLIR